MAFPMAMGPQGALSTLEIRVHFSSFLFARYDSRETRKREREINRGSAGGTEATRRERKRALTRKKKKKKNTSSLVNPKQTNFSLASISAVRCERKRRRERQGRERAFLGVCH